MVRFYVAKIRAGKITLENVPVKWKVEVEKMLENKDV